MKFFQQSATRLEISTGRRFQPSLKNAVGTTNVLDLWIMSSLQSLIAFVREELGVGYRLYTVVGRLVSFVDDLTNWYIRLSRGRLKGLDGDETQTRQSLSVLFEVRTLSDAHNQPPYTPLSASLMIVQSFPMGLHGNRSCLVAP